MTHRTWQLQEAKNHFSEVINNCQTAPQIITKFNHNTAVVLSYTEYIKLMKKKEKLSDFFKNSPLFGSGIDLDDRSKELPREIEL